MFIILGFGGIFGGILCWCGGGLGIWCGNLGGFILGGIGFLGIGFGGKGFFGGCFVGVEDIGIGGCCRLVIRGMGLRGGWFLGWFLGWFSGWFLGWFLGVCICIGGLLVIVGGLDEGKLGVLGVYLDSDVRRFFC